MNPTLTRSTLYFIFVIVLFLFSLTSFGQPENVRSSINAVKVNKPIQLTGRLDDPAWEKADPVELLFETDPGNNISSSQRTEASVLFDSKTIYFGFRCFDDNPSQIRSNVTDQDKIFNDDYIRIRLDMFGDYQKTYEFAVNPAGIKGDMLNGDSNFNIVWETKGHINESGWTAEMAIPFSSLTFPNKDIQSWLLTIERVVPRSITQTLSWTRWDKNVSNPMEQAGLINGLKNISAGGKLEILPYVMSQKVGFINDDSDPESGIGWDDLSGRTGGSITYYPSSNLKIEAVINPDFSQIETDAAQLSVNTTFALMYPEKRPFFLSGMDILSNLFYYTRMINNPVAAAKISGKSGPVSYVYQGAYDRNTIFIIPGEERSNTVNSDLKSFSNIGRAVYDFGNETYIGVSFLTKNMEDGYNYVWESDFSYKFMKNWYLYGRYYFTQTKEINDTLLFNSDRLYGNTPYDAGFNGEKYDGNRLSVELKRITRKYAMRAIYSHNSPAVQMYNAYNPKTGIRQASMSHTFSFYPQNSFITKGSIGISSTLTYNYFGEQKRLQLAPSLILSMKGQTQLVISQNMFEQELFSGINFQGLNTTRFGVSSKPFKELSGSFELSMGESIYRKTSPELGRGYNLSAGIQLQPSSKIDVSFTYSKAKLSDTESDELFYSADIYRTVTNLNFSSKLFFRLICQYDSYAGEVQFYPLLSYKSNAFTTFYIGATSDYFDYGESFGLRSTGRQYFVKFQYLFTLNR